MNYEIYSYWNIIELQGVFNAIAALTASSDFTGLLRVLALIAIVSLVLAVLAGRARHEDFWRWVIMLAIMNGLMIVPKSTVILVDRTGTEPNRVVSNVPIGLAVLAHTTTKFGDWLTRAYETVFSLPNDLQFQKHGLMFGHAMLTETQVLSPDMASGTWMKDFQEFWRECVTPDIVSGYLSVDTLRNSTNLWADLGGTNPARYVTLSTVGTVPCHPTAYNDLGSRLDNAVVPAIITSYGTRKFPGDAMAVTNTKNGIVAAYSYGLGVSNTAEAIVKQAAVQQAMTQAYCGVFAQSGDSNRAALCYSTGMGAYQTNKTYETLAEIARSSMPKLKSAIEIVQYAVAPIIIAFAVVAGHLALRVLKTYAMSLVWVQLWAPLYAVVHYIQTVKMQNYQDVLGAAAGTLQGSATLFNMGVSDQAVAGMLVVAIPPIAAALVKGGEVGLQAVAGLVSAPRTAERQAADTAKGNESVGQWKTAPTIDYAASPAPVMARRSDDGSYTYAHPDGSTTYNSSTARDSATFSVRTIGRTERSASHLSEEAQTAATGQLVSAAKSIGASMQRAIDFSLSHLRETGNENKWGIDNAAEVAKAAETAQNIQDKYLKEHGVNEKLHAAIKGTAQAVAQTPKLLDALSPVSLQGKLAAELGSETDAAIAAKHALDLARTQGYSEAVRTVAKATQSKAFSEAEKSTTGAKDSLQALTTEGMQHIDQASASFQKSLAYKELASAVRSGAVSIDLDLTTRVMNRLANERATIDGHTYNGFKKHEVDALMRNNNPEMLAMVERIANEETEAMLRERFGNLKTPEEVRAFFKEGKERIPGKNEIVSQGNEWRDKVLNEANQASCVSFFL